MSVFFQTLGLYSLAFKMKNKKHTSLSSSVMKGGRMHQVFRVFDVKTCSTGFWQPQSLGSYHFLAHGGGGGGGVR